MKYNPKEIEDTLKKAAKMLTAFQEDQCIAGEMVGAYLDQSGDVGLHRHGDDPEDDEWFDVEDVARILSNDQQEAKSFIEQERIKEQIAELASKLESDRLDIGRLNFSQTAILKNIEKKQEDIQAKEEQLKVLRAQLEA